VGSRQVKEKVLPASSRDGREKEELNAMPRGDFGWDYPPGVTGNEPQIAGYDDEDYIHVDANEVEIKVGDKVKWGDSDEPNYQGVVDHFTDPEGDVDDEGRSISIDPRCYVKFDDGTVEWDNGFYERHKNHFMFEEIVKVAE
jgi:hypothetical protein